MCHDKLTTANAQLVTISRVVWRRKRCDADCGELHRDFNAIDNVAKLIYYAFKNKDLGTRARPYPLWCTTVHGADRVDGKELVYGKAWKRAAEYDEGRASAVQVAAAPASRLVRDQIGAKLEKDLAHKPLFKQLRQRGVDGLRAALVLFLLEKKLMIAGSIATAWLTQRDDFEIGDADVDVDLRASKKTDGAARVLLEDWCRIDKRLMVTYREYKDVQNRVTVTCAKVVVRSSGAEVVRVDLSNHEPPTVILSSATNVLLHEVDGAILWQPRHVDPHLPACSQREAILNAINSRVMVLSLPHLVAWGQMYDLTNRDVRGALHKRKEVV